MSSAQGFRFDLAFGDAATAALNNSNVGDFLDPNGITKIGIMGSEAVFQYWITPFESRTFNGGIVFVGFDKATANNSTTYESNEVAQMAGLYKKLILGDEYENFATGLAAVNSADGSPTVGDIQPVIAGSLGRASFRASRAVPNTTNLRSVGLNFSYTLGLGIHLSLTQGTPIRIMDLRVKNASIKVGEVFGDVSDENGLTLNREAPGGPYGVNVLSGYHTAPSLKYPGQAVPEPATILAL